MIVPSWHEEPIRKSHDREAFDCGNAALNEFLRRHARKSHERGGAKTFLAIDDADGKTILGFYSISPATLGYDRTPSVVKRGLAHHDQKTGIQAPPFNVVEGGFDFVYISSVFQ